MTRAAIAVVAFAVGLGGGQPEEARIAGMLTALAANGSTVVAGVHRGRCAVLVAWESGAPPRELRRVCARKGVVTFELVAASGGAVAWISAHRLGSQVERTLATASLAGRRSAPRVLSRAVAVERRGRRATGETIDALVGDPAAARPVFAFRKHLHTGASHRPDNLYLVRGGSVVSLVRNAIVGLGGADDGRFAVVFPLPGWVLVLGARGETVARIEVEPDRIPVAAKLRGRWLVVVSGRRAGAEATAPFSAQSWSVGAGTPSATWPVEGVSIEAGPGFAFYTEGGRLVRRDLESAESVALADAGPGTRFAPLEGGVVTGSTREAVTALRLVRALALALCALGIVLRLEQQRSRHAEHLLALPVGGDADECLHVTVTAQLAGRPARETLRVAQSDQLVPRWRPEAHDAVRIGNCPLCL